MVPNDVGMKFRSPSRLGIRAIVPSLIRSERPANQSLYEHSFAVVGPTLWNTLPADITTIEGGENFKIKLTSYLKTLRDEPPISGYVRRDDNSLPQVSSPAGSR